MRRGFLRIGGGGRRAPGAVLALAAAAVAAAGVQDAAACGGLVAPDGAVRLARATTLVAWHGGVEHYLTSFAYQGDVAGVGWIVPLPTVPDSVVKGGSWSLQRLEREAEPAPEFALAGEAPGGGGAAADVVLSTTVDSLDISVLRGSGQAVVDWCAAHHFTLNDETRAHILAYAQASPVFMAARYDTGAARLRGFVRGDGTPVLLTLRTSHLWVPLEVLATAHDPVSADLFLLTDGRPTRPGGAELEPGGELTGAPGFRMVRQEEIPAGLHDDLAAQPNMEWVPATGWFTALRLEAPGDAVTYDLTVAGGRISLAPAGVGPQAVDRPVAALGASPFAGDLPTPGAGSGVEVGWLLLGLGVLLAPVLLGGGAALLARWRIPPPVEP